MAVDDSYRCFIGKSDVFKLYLCKFSLKKQFFLRKLFSRNCTLRGKNDVQMTFDDSNICYVNKIDVF